MADPKTPRPADVEFDNDYYTNPKYAGTVWYIADHLKDPSKRSYPLLLYNHNDVSWTPSSSTALPTLEITTTNGIYSYF